MTAPRLFHLQRHADVSGVSGTGHVADGVIWPDGATTIRWRGERPSTVHWDHIGHAKAVHGHGGATEIVLDDNPRDRLARIAEAHYQDTASAGLTSGDCAECGHAWPCPTRAWATTERDPLATWDPADDEPVAEPCPAGLLPAGDGPVERCMVEGPHETHVAPTGKRWTA